jgi:hypothetical protein
MMPEMLPEGTARAVPKGSRLVLQLHYHRSGQTESDQSEVGLYLAKEPVKKTVNLGIALDFRLAIPPGKDEHVSRAHWTTPRDAEILAVFPHMHVLGKDIKMTAYLPDGSTLPLVDVPRYDFNWQRNYFYEEPVTLPAGTRIETVAVYNNTDQNPNNPNSPPQFVRFGMGTNDEMNVGFITLAWADEDRVAQGLGFPTESSIVMDASVNPMAVPGSLGGSGDGRRGQGRRSRGDN